MPAGPPPRVQVRTAVDAGSGSAYDAVSPTAPEEALSSAYNVVSAADWLDAGLKGGIQEPDAEEVPDVQYGGVGWRARWRLQRVCISADGGEGEASIVEPDDKEDASESGIASLDV